MYKYAIAAGFFATVATAWTVAASAQSPLPAVMEGMPTAIAERVLNKRKRMIDDGLLGTQSTRGAASGFHIWRTDKREIEVCIDAKASIEVRKLIMTAAKAWQAPDNHIPMNFGIGPDGTPRACSATGKPSDIRVYFHSRDQRTKDDFSGRWSLIGTDAIDSMVAGATHNPSMNLEGIDKVNLADPVAVEEARRSITHEFGHALGLWHEHQHPFSSCFSHIDWNKTGAILMAHPYFWDQDKIRRNFMTQAEAGMVVDSKDGPDPRSIMYYPMRAAFFKDSRPPSCVVERDNMLISDRDRAIIAQLYPKNPKEQKDLLDARRQRVIDLIAAKAKASGKQIASHQLQTRGATLFKDLFDD